MVQEGEEKEVGTKTVTAIIGSEYKRYEYEYDGDKEMMVMENNEYEKIGTGQDEE